MGILKIKSVYAPPEASDGMRIFVDRLWPPGINKRKAEVQEWLKELGPTDTLRRWFEKEPEKWEDFKRRYRRELESPYRIELMDHIAEFVNFGDVTLLFASRDEEHNAARALVEVINKNMAGGKSQ